MGVIYYAARMDMSEFFDMDKWYRFPCLSSHAPTVLQPTNSVAMYQALMRDYAENNVLFRDQPEEQQHYANWLAKTFVEWTKGEPVLIMPEYDERLSDYDEMNITGGIDPGEYKDGKYVGTR
jgi:hypothetical protein